MPALQTVDFIGTHVDNNLPVITSTGTTHDLLGPDNAEAGQFDQVFYVDCHETITMPVGIIGFITSVTYVDVPSTPFAAASLLSHTIIGNASPIALSVGGISPRGVGYTFTDACYCGNVSFIQTCALKYVLV